MPERRRFFFLFIAFVAFSLFGQGEGGRLLAAAAAEPDISKATDILVSGLPSIKAPEEKKEIFKEIASLEEIQGHWDKAAARWSDASFAVPGNRDQESLLRSALCWAKAGEYAKAEGEIRVVLLTGSEANFLARARYLSAWILAAKGSAKEAREIALALLGTAPLESSRPALLLLLYLSAEPDARIESYSRLKKAYPESPETLLAQSMEDKGNTVARPFPEAFWLLSSLARTKSPDLSAPTENEKKTELVKASDAPAKSEAVEPKLEVPKNKAEPADSQGSAAKIVEYRIGSFAQEANAKRFAAELTKKGFISAIEKWEGKDKILWTVSVPAGSDPEGLLLRLKDTGYEPYPIFR